MYVCIYIYMLYIHVCAFTCIYDIRRTLGCMFLNQDSLLPTDSRNHRWTSEASPLEHLAPRALHSWQNVTITTRLQLPMTPVLCGSWLSSAMFRLAQVDFHRLSNGRPSRCFLISRLWSTIAKKQLYPQKKHAWEVLGI